MADVSLFIPPPVIPATPAPCVPIENFITGFRTVFTSTSSTAVSAYTRATSIQCIIDTVSAVSPVLIVNNYNLLVTYGDGAQEQINQASNSTLKTIGHTYNWPGVYEVKISVIPKLNYCEPKVFTHRVSAFNYITDSVEWNYSAWSDLTSAALLSGALLHGYQSCKPGPLGFVRPISFNYNVSSSVSTTINFELYSENSLSQPGEIVTVDNKYAQLRPCWRFLNEIDSIITSISANAPTPVYITWNGTRTTAESGTLVGYTGTEDFYYIDDIPSLTYTGSYSVNVPTLWVIYNTSLVPNLQDNNDGQAPSYSNSKIGLSANFYVKNLSADHFNISSNGGYISLPTIIWPDTDTEFIVTVNSATLSSTSEFSNKSLLNYPLLNTVNSSISALVSPLTGASVYSPVFNLSRYNSSNKDTGGYYKNILSTLPSTSVLLSAGDLSSNLYVRTLIFTTLDEPPAYNGNYTLSTRISQATAYNSLRQIPLSGNVNFTIEDFNKNYFTRKVNENFNYGAQLQAYALQPFIAENNNLFAFLSAAAGDNVHPDENFGTVVYEKIANFVANNQDIHTSNVEQLYALVSLVDTEFDNFNLDVPPVLKREFDLYSTPHERLWGNREKYATNFNALTNHTNLGVELTAYNINTAIVSAGQKIVVNDIFNSNFYELIEVPVVTSYACVTARNMGSYFPPSATYPLLVYPLSAFFGWGLKTPVKDYYRFFVYSEGFSNTPVNNLIDWNTRVDGLSTTLSETASSINTWYKDGGTLENIYRYYITKGLDLLGSKYYRAP